MFVLFLLVLPLAVSHPAIAEDASQAPKELTADEAARQLANPNTPLASLTLKSQYRWYKGDLPGADDQDNFTMLFQPVFPFPVSKTKTDDGEILDQIFFRPAFPLVFDQPVFNADEGRFHGKTGLGDIAFDVAWGRNYPSGLLLALGMVNTLPTATSNELSGKKWLMGPEVFIGYFQKWGVVGIFPNHQWDVTGWSDTYTSITSIQPFAVFLPGRGWSVGTAGIMSYDWRESQWTLPLQLQISKTIKVGSTPVKLAFEVNYYVEQADPFGPEWMIGLNITPVVKNIFAE